MVASGSALPGRETPVLGAITHTVLGSNVLPPFDDHLQQAVFAMGCFWGAERKFWSLSGVHSTSVGYCAGYTPNPTYQEVCSGQTGHTEAVSVIYDPTVIGYEDLLKVFWENHNPTQGMRQGNDVGTQYRSGIYALTSTQYEAAEHSLNAYQNNLAQQGGTTITTEVCRLDNYYYAEDYHQQYLAKNPDGYCGLGGTGVAYCG